VKWHNHKILTAAVVFTATHNFISTIAATIGSIFPDLIEIWLYGDNGNKNHRKLSHWWVIYFAGILLFSHFAKITVTYSNLLQLSKEGQLQMVLFFIAKFFMVGALLHIIQDTFCGKVPLLNPNKKEFGFRIFKTGSFGEYVFTSLVIIIMVTIFIFKKGGI